MSFRSSPRWRGPALAACAPLILLSVLALSACGRGSEGEGRPQPGDEAVARVEERTVWASDVRREAVAQGRIEEGQPLDVSSPLFRQILDEVVDQRLLAAEAERRGLDDTAAGRRRLAAARDRMLADMVVEAEINDAVTEEQVRALWREMARLSPQSEQLRARHIVTRTQAEAEAVRRLLDAGGDFDAIALERSTDAATRFNGGDLGWFTLNVMPPGYTRALAQAQAGEVVGPFPVDPPPAAGPAAAGEAPPPGPWAVVRVEGRRREAPLSLREARPQIMRFLTFDEVRTLLLRLRNGSEVEILIPNRAAPRARQPAAAPPVAATSQAPSSAVAPARPGPTPPPAKGAQP